MQRISRGRRVELQTQGKVSVVAAARSVFRGHFTSESRALRRRGKASSVWLGLHKVSWRGMNYVSTGKEQGWDPKGLFSQESGEGEGVLFVLRIASLQPGPAALLERLTVGVYEVVAGSFSPQRLPPSSGVSCEVPLQFGG